jgi:hypothetical protein
MTLVSGDFPESHCPKTVPAPSWDTQVADIIRVKCHHQVYLAKFSKNFFAFDGKKPTLDCCKYSTSLHHIASILFILPRGQLIRLDYTIPRFPTATIEDGVLILELKYRVRSPRAVRPLPPRTGWKVKS